MLNALEVELFFADIRCGDDEGPVKPDVSVLTEIADSLQLKVGDLIMVGDTVSDLAMARKAGAALCCWYYRRCRQRRGIGTPRRYSY